MKGVVDSLDGEFVYTKDEVSDNSDSDDDDNLIDLLFTMPIEIKARVAHTTFYAKRHQLDTNVEATKGLAAFENGEPVYHEINAEGGSLRNGFQNTRRVFNYFIMLLFLIKERDYFL